jgi:uncharacterized membrane protein YdjX (TVP38/TMEM64 family)
MENSNWKAKQQTILMVGSTVFMIAAIAYFVNGNLLRIESFIAGKGTWGLLLLVAFYGLLGLTIIPSEPLTILTGALFGPWNATLVATLGNILSAVVEYYLGGRINKLTNFVEKKEQLPFGLGKLPVTSPVFLIFARMIPGYGAKAVSVLCGVYRVPMVLYIWTTAIPTFLGSAIFAFGGFGVGKIKLF